ncbi:MAG TPA: GSCFA domain-containing protein [Cytophagaceae bacterium]|jgi:hypothetical protein|nr:GSCFA domain-containing protein [Cytophagaceae bacterium]
MFRTEFTIGVSSTKLNHQNKILTIGSCFSQVIGERLLQNKFDVLVNPFGTIFNPISIFKLLKNALLNDFETIDAAVENHGVWFNYHVHSELYGSTKEVLNSKLKGKLQQVNDVIKQTDFLIITFGTAFIYKLKSTNEVVANCHKVSGNNFDKELLTVKEISNSCIDFIQQANVYNPKLKIILTVSPVRHTKDSILLNSVSKSVLRLACHELSEQFSEILYFPSYEIMMDDLRDYRFYKEDMIHPTEVAENYIWNKFSDAYFEEKTKEIIKEWESVFKALQHKPFHIESAEYRKFLTGTMNRLELLKEKIDVRKEIESLRIKLAY